jgi:hypothetical protein
MWMWLVNVRLRTLFLLNVCQIFHLFCSGWHYTYNASEIQDCAWSCVWHLEWCVVHHTTPVKYFLDWVSSLEKQENGWRQHVMIWNVLVPQSRYYIYSKSPSVFCSWILVVHPRGWITLTHTCHQILLWGRVHKGGPAVTGDIPAAGRTTTFCKTHS